VSPVIAIDAWPRCSLASELRFQRGLSASLLKQLHLPDEPERGDIAGRARSVHARNAALQRWGTGA
jgi:hypothetical protein